MKQYLILQKPVQKHKKTNTFTKKNIKQAKKVDTVKKQLLDRIFTFENLKNSYVFEEERRPAPGIDKQTAFNFGLNLNNNLYTLKKELINGYYKPISLLRIETKDKKKPIFITSFRDRLVQRTIVRYLSTRWEKMFSNSSYAFRPGRSHQDAQKRVLQICQTKPYIAIIDIKHFFESVSHLRLSEKLYNNLYCRRTVNLIMYILNYDNNLNKGLVRGFIISPLLSNFYLNDFDWQMTRTCQIVRYCDDMAIMADSRKQLKEQLKKLKDILKYELLKIHRWKRQVTRYDKGFYFLGTYFKKA